MAKSSAHHEQGKQLSFLSESPPPRKKTPLDIRIEQETRGGRRPRILKSQIEEWDPQWAIAARMKNVVVTSARRSPDVVKLDKALQKIRAAANRARTFRMMVSFDPTGHSSGDLDTTASNRRPDQDVNGLQRMVEIAQSILKKK